MSKPIKCKACGDTGVIETGNNDFHCSCEAGATVILNGPNGPERRQSLFPSIAELIAKKQKDD